MWGVSLRPWQDKHIYVGRIWEIHVHQSHQHLNNTEANTQLCMPKHLQAHTHTHACTHTYTHTHTKAVWLWQRRFGKSIMGHHIRLCCSSHKWMFLTNVAAFKRELLRFSCGIRFSAREYDCYMQIKLLWWGAKGFLFFECLMCHHVFSCRGMIMNAELSLQMLQTTNILVVTQQGYELTDRYWWIGISIKSMSMAAICLYLWNVGFFHSVLFYD